MNVLSRKPCNTFQVTVRFSKCYPLLRNISCLATCYLATTRSLLFVVTGMWFPIRCSAMDVCSGSTIPALSHHVTVLSNHFACGEWRTALRDRLGRGCSWASPDHWATVCWEQDIERAYWDGSGQPADRLLDDNDERHLLVYLVSYWHPRTTLLGESTVHTPINQSINQSSVQRYKAA
jgi:hypothetical protein